MVGPGVGGFMTGPGDCLVFFLLCLQALCPLFWKVLRAGVLWLFSPNSCVSGEQLGDASDSAKREL